MTGNGRLAGRRAAAVLGLLLLVEATAVGAGCRTAPQGSDAGLAGDVAGDSTSRSPLPAHTASSTPPATVGAADDARAGTAQAPTTGAAQATTNDAAHATTTGNPAVLSLAAHGDAQASTRVLTADDLKGLTWRNVGPANMGGRVADIALAPGSAKIFYVGFGTSGLVKTTNNGTTFAPLFDKEVTASIGSVVVCDAPPDWPGWKDEPADSKAKGPATADPAGTAASLPSGKDDKADTKDADKADTKDVDRASSKDKDKADAKDKDKGKAKIVWVGTGEGNGRNSSSYGNGVYRSTDGGATFVHCGLADSHDIPRLAVDPRNPDVCYAAALGHLWGPNKERGLYKTTDGGKTWKPALQIDEDTGAIDVRIDPQNPDIVYAAMYLRRRTPYSYRSGGPKGGLYRSLDAGVSWSRLGGGLPGQTGRIGLDIYAKDTRILYAIVESDIGGFGVEPFDDRSKAGGLFRTEDRGETWTRVHDHSPRAFYFSKVCIDPTDDQRIYVLGWGLNISDDGGKTFRAGGARRPHGDLHAMVIDPADRDHLVLGTDGGVYQSYDRGETWDFLNHLAVGEFYNIALDMSDPYRIAGGLQDNGSWVGPSATIRDTGGDEPDQPGGGITNHDWQFLGWGDGFHCAFDPANPNLFYSEAQGGELVRTEFDTGRRKLIRPSPKEGQPRFRFNWNSPFFVSPHNPTTVYFGGNHVFKLTDRGQRWESISEDLSTRDLTKILTVGSEAETHGTVVSLAESPVKAGVLWAGTDDGLVHATFDAGKTWTNVTPAEVGGRYISKIEPSHHDAARAFMAVDGHRNDDMNPHVLVTHDGGKAWSDITSDLPPGAHAKVIREDVKNPNVLYAGTERAAYVSIDAGGHWTRLNADSLPTVAVDDLAQHPRDMDLVAGTHGRSIWILDDAAPLSQLSPQVVQSPLHAFDMLPAKPKFFLPYEGFWTDRVFKAPNPPMGARIYYWLRDYTTEPVKITIADARDVPVRSLTGGSRIGMNRVVWDLQREKRDQLPNPDAGLGQTQFVPPGEYTVTVTCGKLKATTKVTVLPAPGATPESK